MILNTSKKHEQLVFKMNIIKLQRPIYYIARTVIIRAAVHGHNNRHLLQPIMTKLFDSSMTLIQNHGIWFTIKVFNILKGYLNLPFKEGLTRLSNILPSDKFQSLVSIFSMYGLPALWDANRLLPSFKRYYGLFFITTIVGNLAPIFLFAGKVSFYALTGSVAVVYGGILGSYSIIKDVALRTIDFYEWALDLKIKEYVFKVRDLLRPTPETVTNIVNFVKEAKIRPISNIKGFTPF